VDAGGKRAQCRRRVLGDCRAQGASVCLDAGDEARKAAPSALYAPLVLNATAMTPNLIALGWQDSTSKEHGYSVERSMNGTNFVEIVQTVPDATGYNDPGRLADTLYYYRVRAFRIRRSQYSSGLDGRERPDASTLPRRRPRSLHVASVDSATTASVGRQPRRRRSSRPTTVAPTTSTTTSTTGRHHDDLVGVTSGSTSTDVHVGQRPRGRRRRRRLDLYSATARSGRRPRRPARRRRPARPRRRRRTSCHRRTPGRTSDADVTVIAFNGTSSFDRTGRSRPGRGASVTGRAPPARLRVTPTRTRARTSSRSP
jgi:hypothetical protein